MTSRFLAGVFELTVLLLSKIKDIGKIMEVSGEGGRWQVQLGAYRM